MGLRLKRVWTEALSVWEAFEDWYEEMVVQNGPRYAFPVEWVHLYVDILGATLQLLGRIVDRSHYTFAHLLGVGLPAWGLYELWRWISG